MCTLQEAGRWWDHLLLVWEADLEIPYNDIVLRWSSDYTKCIHDPRKT